MAERRLTNSIRTLRFHAGEMTQAELGERIGVTRQTVYNLIARGQLRRFHVGRSARVPVADVLALIGGGDDPAA